VGFDGDAALTFEVHGVQKLFLSLPLLDGAGKFEETIREGRLAVVDMRDDAKVAREFDCH